MDSSPYIALLEALRTNCSLPEFPDPLPSTQLDLELENGPTVTIDFDQDSQFVELFSELGTYPLERELEILKKIAASNFLWSETSGATLSVRPEIQTAYLALQLPVLSLDGTNFVGIVEKFVETVKQWQEVLANAPAEENIPAGNEEPSTEVENLPPPSPQEFLLNKA